ncbi:Nuclear transport factor 2 eukaryote [Arabidopsis suecica]|uniref:Nuclear transport factor 2 eukaryote n=1 Tax=Arabidopsis suecica TaxID=45249 RepID=A0A8T1XPD5_ARASU|nr:Nuclear transport factor 2 eukaryote [Arabidopsis suecica]
MATPYPGATQVGSYFVGQYYQVLQQQPDLIHQFYSEPSRAIRIDGDSTETANTLLHIHNMVMSLNFTAIEVKTINSVESWEGGVLVVVSGSVKTKEFTNRRSFVQTFFLAPQEKGYFVLNDIFQFVDEGTVYYHQPSYLSETKHEAQLNPPSHHPEPQVPDYVLEEEARDYVNAVQIKDDLVDKYSLQEDQHQPQHEVYEDEVAIEETPREEVAVDVVHEHRAAPAEEPVVEKSKMSYASILKVAKEAATVPVVATQPSYNKNSQDINEWDQPMRTPSPQLAAPLAPVQQSNASSTYVSDYGAEAEDGSGFEDFEFKSVYVRNLPSDISASEIEEEFKNFGTIKPDGVFLRTRKDVMGVCYAFVEFEDMTSVENAIKASPIYLGGRQVYIEERRPNPAGVRGARRGGGRGRGGYPTEAPRGRFGARGSGRGNQDGGDYRPRGNGYYRGGGR